MRKIRILWLFLLVILLTSCIQKRTMTDMVFALSDDHLAVAPTPNELLVFQHTIQRLGCDQCRVKAYVIITGEGHDCETLIIEFQTIGEAGSYYDLYKYSLEEKDKDYPMIRRRDQIVILSNSEQAIKKALGITS